MGGDNSIEVVYGKPSQSPMSSCTDAFYFCDQFSDNQWSDVFRDYTPDHEDENTEEVEVTVEVKEVNQQIEIIGQSNDNIQYQILGFEAYWSLNLPSSNNYAFEASIQFAELGNSTAWKAAFGGWERK